MAVGERLRSEGQEPLPGPCGQGPGRSGNQSARLRSASAVVKTMAGQVGAVGVMGRRGVY